MQRFVLVISAASVLSLCAEVPLRAQKAGVDYPRVYGPAGKPYGPTQAHYQYQRRYGRVWQGGTSQQDTGRIHSHSPGHHRFQPRAFAPHFHAYNGYYAYPGSFGYASPGFSFYAGPQYGVYGAYPAVPGYVPPPLNWRDRPHVGWELFGNNAMQEALELNEQQWKAPLDLDGKKPPALPPLPSSPEAKLKSLRAQAHGDQWLRDQNFALAYDRYKQAVSFAEDRAEARFRLAFAMVARGDYIGAVQQVKRGLQIDPSWPLTGTSLETLFGPDNVLLKSSITHKLVNWVREDIRDPDRLFLMGVWLHFDDQPENANVVFETAYRLSGGGDHLVAFLNPQVPDEADQPPGEAKVKPPAQVLNFPAPKAAGPPGGGPQMVEPKVNGAAPAETGQQDAPVEAPQDDSPDEPAPLDVPPLPAP